MAAPLLIIGLGNPGAEYAATRHNIGFMAAEALHTAYKFSTWKKKFHGEIAEGVIAGRRTLLLKPMTFMNRSGLAAGVAAQFHKIPLTDIFVLHDEIELIPGKVRIKQGGGAAGHNGLKSLDDALGKDYWRVRLGVGRPVVAEQVHDYVLEPFKKAELTWVRLLCETLAAEAALLVDGKHNVLMNKLTLALFPNEKKTKEPKE